MKWLLMVVLALTVSISGCNKTGDMNKTGFRCPTCDGEVANDTPRCVRCGQKYNYSDIHNLLVKNNFIKIYKSKMPFRKTFEYIYMNKSRA